MRAFAVVPALDEAAAIGPFVAELLAGACAGAIVVDGGSRDGTPELAAARGARVVVEPRRGYGLAVARGIAAARDAGADAYIVMDGNGSVDVADVRAVLAPVASGRADLSIGWRRGASLRRLQRLGNRLAVELIARAHGVRYRDVGAIRAITAAAFCRLDIDDVGYGWPLQLQVRAASRGLRIAQVPVTPRPRSSRSKVSGTARGVIGASAAFLRVLATECVVRR